MYSSIQELSKRFEEYTTLICSFLVSAIFYRKRDLASADIRRIVVIKLDHIGDVILSIPTITNLRAHFPCAHITMVVNSSSKLVASFIPYVDELMCYDARFFDRSGSVKRLDFSRGLRFIREMRKQEFDLIVDLRGSFASAFFALIAKSGYRIDRGTYLVQRKLGRASLSSEHEAEVNLDILARVGIPVLSRELALDLSREDLDNAALLLKECMSKEHIIVLHPGGPSQLKRWAVERYAILADRLSREYDAHIVLVGGKGEEPVARAVMSAMLEQAIDLSGQTTLGQLAAILQKAALFIGNDSGPMHLAAACGTKVIGLFGPTSPRRFGPYGDFCAALRMEVDCPPCMKDECKRANYRCIDQISIDNVMKVGEKLLNL